MTGIVEPFVAPGPFPANPYVVMGGGIYPTISGASVVSLPRD